MTPTLPPTTGAVSGPRFAEVLAVHILREYDDPTACTCGWNWNPREVINAVAECCHLHQDGKTREQWHLDACGAIHMVRAVEKIAEEWGWISDDSEYPTRYDMWRQLRDTLSTRTFDRDPQRARAEAAEAERDTLRAVVEGLRGVLTEWGVLAQDGDFVSDDDFAEAIRDSGAWRLARELRALLPAEDGA